MSMKHVLLVSAMRFAPLAFDGEKLKITYDNGDEVPEAYKGLFTEQNGKFVLTGVEGVKSQGDVDRVQGALVKERGDFKKLRDAIRTAFGIDATAPLPDFATIAEQIQRIPELEAAVEAAGDPKNNKKIEELVEAKVKAKLSPVERELNEAKNKLGEKDAVIAKFETEKRTRKVHDAVRAEAEKSKMLGSAIEDANFRAERLFEEDEAGNLVMKDGVGYTQGITVADWLAEQQTKAPHWWPASEGGGAGGKGPKGDGGVKNPFTAEHWSLSDQGALYRKDASLAAKMAVAAGTTIGGKKPAPKK
jgi:hypothetical protein